MRTWAQLREAYTIEKELADRLRKAPWDERRHLYTELYNEWLQRVPSSPMITRRNQPEYRVPDVAIQMGFLRRFLRADMTFLEVGPGDCSLAIEVAKIVRQVYAVDVSDEIAKPATWPTNFVLAISDGRTVPVRPASVDLAYSNQLMEHLHPDDASEQLQGIYESLKPGGAYVCITPNRINGPHDISKYFDDVATGFHLKEYTNLELSTLLHEAGFSRVRRYIGTRGVYRPIPLLTVYMAERLMGRLSHQLRQTIGLTLPMRLLLDIRLVAIK
jgi:SAM-dependent methyltransferase